MNSNKSSNHKKYETKNPVKAHFIKNFKKTFTEIEDFMDNNKICDLGCGEGFIINHLLSKNPTLNIQGYDLEESAIKIAKELNPSASFGTVNVTNIDEAIKNQQFDYVLLMEVLEHIPEFEKVLKQVQQMKFKKFIISVPNEPLFSYGNLIFGKNIKRLGKDIEHVNFWNEKTFKTLLNQYFNVIKIKKPFPWLMCVCEKK